MSNDKNDDTRGLVRASETMDVMKLYAELRDLVAEAIAVDTVIGRPNVLVARLTRLRDEIGRARNGLIPLTLEGWAATRQPITEEMHKAAVKVLQRANGLAGLPQRMLDAMLAAAPKQATDEREAFIQWLSGSYSHVYTEDKAAHSWDNGHVAALAWKARAAVAASPSESIQPDMFWNDDDPERMEHSVLNVVTEADDNMGLSIGDEITIQCAKRLPNIKVRITSVPDDEGNGDVEWEEIDAARTQGASQ